MITLGILLVIIAAGCLLLGAVGWGVFVVLVQLGVIVQQAGKPHHLDSNDYHLEQGREIKGNDQKK